MPKDVRTTWRPIRSRRRADSKRRIDAFCAAGWPGLAGETEYGGQGLPHLLQIAFYEMQYSTNQAWAMYPGLTIGATECFLLHGSEEQKNLYLPKLTTGQWTGTMCLTEPHCGTDLGMLRTKAEPQADGSYQLSGQKIFISSGEHDFAENIVHLVLARLPDAPQGTKGISLFIVPKFLPVGAGGGCQSRCAQRSVLRWHRAQDGNPRQRDLPDES